MNLNLKATIVALLACASAYAQSYTVKAVLKDSQSGEAVSFATVSLHNPANDKGIAYELSDENGKATLEGVKNGNYIFRAELLGYKKFEKKIEVKDADLDLGTVKMAPDARMLEAAKVTDRGNPIQMKRDTISFTASTFKTTDNDMLEDLLKKIPGMEISENGTITHNGKEISKITIDGKTFFLNDPQVATKNLPAKIVDKLRVVEKKSDQAEFTGIDDGEEETILDLSIKPGMMNGLFGNVMGGAGHDIPSTDITGDWRWQTGGFVGNFSTDFQVSGVFNANNTNNRGFNDLAGSMMGNMRGGGMGGPGMGQGQGGWGQRNGITTSYMGGLNVGTNLFDDKMELSGNYMYNGTEQSVEEQSSKTTHLEDSDLIYNSTGSSLTGTHGHRIGMRMEHKFSDNTSVIFEPRINFGGGDFLQQDSTYTDTYTLATDATTKTNDSKKLNSGANKNLSASGFALLRQKLGIPGRTITVMGRYSVSQNNLNGNNYSLTNVYDDSGTPTATEINQNYSQLQNSYSAFARATYTQPIVDNLYAEINLAYNWNKSISDKATTDAVTGAAIDSYSNHITNDFSSEEAGANLLYQREDFRAQLGFAVIPSKTHNYTQSGAAYKVDTTITRFNWSPTAMVFGEIGENGSVRLFYRGRSQTPSTNQLITVADNSNPLAVSFGNPNLAPYFSHNLNGDIRYNNKKTYASVNARINGSYTQDPIVNANWYTGGVTYSMPINGPASIGLGGNIFANIPIAKTNFTVFNMLRVNWSQNSSYVGKDINTATYLNPDGSLDYNKFFADYDLIRPKLTENQTKTLGITERLRITYRIDALEFQVSGRTRMSHSDYFLADTRSETTTWNNELAANSTWTHDLAGLSLKGEFMYHWYKGYATQQPDEYIFNAEISKQILKKKATVALKGYDILGQAKNLTVSDSGNVHTESLNNTLGRYVILSFTYRFGTFDRSKMRGPGGPGGPGGPPPMR
ncbi:MAG: outer membrane beta-barrel protein [Bacteroidales bacterium]|nr:outer membrane beta-barrel protein [Bacteroidales bacterium]